MRLSLARRIAVLAVAAALAALGLLLLVALWRLHLRYVDTVIVLGLVCCGTVAMLLVGWKLIKAFLYKVSRRLAFSYFLIGVLPIPMVMLLLGVVAYLLASFFLGHLYRDALRVLETEVTAATHERAALFAADGKPGAAAPSGQSAGAALPGMVFAYYRNGVRVAGDGRAPARWPEWATAAPAGSADIGSAAGGGSAAGEGAARFVARPDHSPALLAAAGDARRGVVGLYAADLDQELSRRSGVWVESSRPEDPQGDVMHVKLWTMELPMLTFHGARNMGEAQRFFKLRSQGDAFWDRQMLWWGQSSGPFLDLASGRQIAGNLLINLNGTPRVLKEHLYTVNGELDARAWSLLVVLAVLLTNVYLIALVMALFMILGLSRAVNRLSSATDAVRRGDFSARIPVRRRDQVGELQRTFNEMAGNLEVLVAESAQKELLDKELGLARDLQNSLIPSNLPRGEGVEFATLFEPSAAIGGDYFDVLRLSERELAVIIADVSGHGLSTGLRMAMLKAALLILVEETREPAEILRRLDGVVRSDRENRCFVTATLAIFDVREGRLDLTNAGHPPTYVVHADGGVDEILLPSSPLGGLGQSYARRELRLDRGDVVVWLSDGLFESVDAAGEPFGYDRVPQALGGGDGSGAGIGQAAARRAGPRGGGRGGGAGAPTPVTPSAPAEIELTAARVRDRLLAAIAAHVGAEPPSDDRTLVVMRWLGPVGEAPVAEVPVGAAVAPELG